MKLPPWLRRGSMAYAYTIPTDAPAAAPEVIEPTNEERRNGWDATSLSKYIAEQRQAESEIAFAMFDKRRFRPKWANSKYSPHHWRRARAR